MTLLKRRAAGHGGGQSRPEDGGDGGQAGIRQGEAAISWTQRQLSRERDARRAAEQEVARARPEADARRRELEHVAALERQVTHLAEERKRRTEGEAQLEALPTQLKDLETRVRHQAREHEVYERLKGEVGDLAEGRGR